MFKLFFLIIPIVFSFSISAFVAENSLEGLGQEILMGGIGQARIGSNGALSSNPALLAWLPKRNEFISTNRISFYKIKAVDGQKLNISPDIVPVLAASTEGFKGWGHSYGVIVSKMKIGLNQLEAGDTIEGKQESQTVNLSYGFGFKSSKNIAWGGGIYVGRTQQDGDFSVIGETNGSEHVYIVRDRETFWQQGISLGTAVSLDTWAFGLSTKLTTTKFWASGRQETAGYTEELNQNFSNISHKSPAIDVVPTVAGGLQKKFKRWKLFVDLNWMGGFTDSDFSDRTPSQVFGGPGLEGRITDRYKLFTGFMHAPGVNGDKDSGLLSFGFSKKNENSQNLFGISWRRYYESAEAELIQINFGTKFGY